MADTSTREIYEVKRPRRVIAKKGRGTELVSVYIPPDRQISDVVKHMREELSQSANIKVNKQKNVQSAIEVIMQRMKLFPSPENGLVLFVGMIPKGGPGTEKMETYVLNLQSQCKPTSTTVTPSSSWNHCRKLLPKRMSTDWR